MSSVFCPRELEDESLYSLEYFRKIFAEIMEPIVIVGLDEPMTLMYGNQAYKDMFGCDDEKINEEYFRVFGNAFKPEAIKLYHESIHNQILELEGFTQEVIMKDALGVEKVAILHGILGPETDNPEKRGLCITINVLDQNILMIKNLREVEKRSEYDELTGCLRKKSFEEYAGAYIEDRGVKSAVFLIDIDDFKHINDNFGHQYGDITLKNIGEGLRELFRESDYIGRIGGDEFMIFIKNISDENILEEKAEAVLEVLRNSHEALIDGHTPSGSVGVAKFPEDGATFEEIYEHADQALYEAKALGKNQYSFFKRERTSGVRTVKTPLEISQLAISKHLDSVLIADMFNLLFEAVDFDASMHSVLKRIGTRFSVDRCYIFEPNDAIEGAYMNTYEWCEKGIEPEIENLQNIPHDMLVGSFFEEADENGVFFCDNINLLKEPEARELMDMQGIKSFLHSYIPGEKLMIAVVGLDDCKEYRHWKPLEITTLMYVNKIIAQFLAYKRAVEKINKDE